MDIIHNEKKTFFKANSPLGMKILVAVWRNCYSSPMDDGELLITPEDYIKATAAFQALGFDIKVGVK